MRVCNPVLETDTIKYSVQPGLGFCAPEYLRNTGSVHTGIDLNDTRGGQSDFGAPVYACADGVVVMASFFPTWGNIVMIYHPALSVWTQYAHLNEMRVDAGAQVPLGHQIGTIGRGAGNRFIAHLHFEVRRTQLPAQAWPSTTMKDPRAAEAYIRKHYLDPEKWLEEHQAIRTLSALEGYLKVQAAPIITPAGPQAVPELAAVFPLYGVPGFDRVRVMKRSDGQGMKAYGIRAGQEVKP